MFVESVGVWRGQIRTLARHRPAAHSSHLISTHWQLGSPAYSTGPLAIWRKVQDTMRVLTERDRERRQKQRETERQRKRDKIRQDKTRKEKRRQDKKREDETIKEKKREDERGETRR